MAKLQTDLREFIVLLNSHHVDSAWQSRVPTVIDDQPVSVLGWEELLRNKRASGRQKDLADLEKLLAVEKRKGAG